MNQPLYILIAGAGYIGAPLAMHFAQMGHQVTAIKQHPIPLTHPNIAWILGDLTRWEEELPIPYDFVFYTAAPSEGNQEGYRAVYQKGPLSLLKHLNTSSLKRYFFTSSTAVYSDVGWVDESTKANPPHWRGEMLLQAEEAITSVLPTSVIRLTGIYGPNRSRFISHIQKGNLGARMWMNRMHQTDIIRFYTLLTRQSHFETLYLGVDREPLDNYACARLLASHWGWSMPAWPSDPGIKNKRVCSQWLKAMGFEYVYPNAFFGYRAFM